MQGRLFLSVLPRLFRLRRTTKAHLLIFGTRLLGTSTCLTTDRDSRRVTAPDGVLEGGIMKTLRIASLLLCGFALSGFMAAEDTKSEPKNIPDFDVQGISMTECQCTAYACPCRSNGHPDHGSCDAADFTYIKQGHYGKVDMSGFKAVLIGDLIVHDASKVQGTAYFDKSPTPAQREAFNEMLCFMFG